MSLTEYIRWIEEEQTQNPTGKCPLSIFLAMNRIWLVNFCSFLMTEANAYFCRRQGRGENHKKYVSVHLKLHVMLNINRAKTLGMTPYNHTHGSTVHALINLKLYGLVISCGFPHVILFLKGYYLWCFENKIRTDKH